MRTIIISAFPGMGKSYSVEHLPQYKMVDFDSIVSPWIKTNEGRIPNPSFEQEYIEALNKLKSQGSY